MNRTKLYKTQLRKQRIFQVVIKKYFTPPPSIGGTSRTYLSNLKLFCEEIELLSNIEYKTATFVAQFFSPLSLHSLRE